MRIAIAPRSAGTALRGVTALAFDASGNLRVASATGPITEFQSSDLTSVGSPKPTIVLTMTDGGLPQSLAFDESGDLWVADLQNNRLVAYTPTQLGATGTPTPHTVVQAASGSINAPAVIGFSPHAGNLPLH